jgi:hypothetical protein
MLFFEIIQLLESYFGGFFVGNQFENVGNLLMSVLIQTILLRTMCLRVATGDRLFLLNNDKKT